MHVRNPQFQSQSGALLSKRAGCRLLNISPPTFDQLAGIHPNFPKPVQLTPNGLKRYRSGDLLAWADSLPPSE